MQEINKQMTILDLAKKIENGEFNRQHDSYIRISKGSNGNILNDVIVKTGEEIEIYNKNQRNAYREKIKKEKAIKEHIINNEGGFVHFVYKYLCPVFLDIETKYEGTKSNIHISRLLQLVTYLNTQNKLYDKNNNRIKKSSLTKIWDTKNRNGVNETYKVLIEVGFIKESIEGYIEINDSIFVRGEVKNFKKMKNEDINTTFTRLFSENIQEMYLNTDSKSRKQLANLFKLLPYINFRHNIICSNPFESDKSKLELLTWTDVAEICGVDSKNVTRFKNELIKLKVKNYDAIGQFSCRGGYYICINPKIYYSGDCIEDVNFLYESFEMFENKN